MPERVLGWGWDQRQMRRMCRLTGAQSCWCCLGVKEDRGQKRSVYVAAVWTRQKFCVRPPVARREHPGPAPRHSLQWQTCVWSMYHTRCGRRGDSDVFAGTA